MTRYRIAIKGELTMTDHLCDTAKKIDCITREAALDFLIPTYDLNISTQDQRILGDRFEEFLKSIPAADVRPVIRAHWIDMKPTNEETGLPISIKGPDFRCSNCGATEFPHNFCPNCGADMRGE